MIVEEIRNIKSGKRELRQFGITIGVVLGLLGMWCVWRGKEGSYPLLISASVFFFLGIIFPVLLKPLQKLWMSLAILLGWLMTRVIVTILFYLVVTPIGLLARVCGKDFLHTKIDKNANSYWSPKEAVTRSKEDYEKQF